jgi:PAS domain S-box-containing protein
MTASSSSRAADTLEHERRAAVILDGMYQFVGLLDPQGNILEINRSALEGAGVRIEEIRGTPFWTARWWQVSEELQEQIRDAIRRAAAGEFVRYEAEVYGEQAGFATIIVDFSLRPIRGASGEIEYLLPEARNITERKQAEEEIARQSQELRILNQRLKELDRLKTQFFANISHEFRTPLTLMLGPLEDALANAHGVLPLGAATDLAASHRNALRLLKLVNTMLDFSRMAGRVQASYQPTDLAAFTAELASNFRSACEKAGLRLIVDCAPLRESESAYVDRDMWEKIVLNLMSNAFKFTLKGEIEVRLEAVDDGAGPERPLSSAPELAGRPAATGSVAPFLDDGAGPERPLSAPESAGHPAATGSVAPLVDRHARLIVRDTGVGIPLEELPRMFERFHRVEHTQGRTHEGTGIGLALVNELVKVHGGTVSVDSVIGEGSTFTVTIPLGKAHLDAEHIGAVSELLPTGILPSAFLEEALGWLPDASAAGHPPSETASEAGGQTPLEPERASGAEASKDEPRRTAKPRILWADDNADMRSYVTRLLSNRFDVRAVPDGEAALAAARAHPPDLVLSDIMMPKLDGVGLLRALRADPELREIPVILLSARAGEESRVEGLEVGADDYLVKPFSARELIARVETHIKTFRIRQEANAALRESEERFKALANTAPVVLWITEADGSCSFLSRGWYDLTGQSEDAGPGFGWLDAVHPDARQEFRRLLLEASRTQEALSLDCQIRRADGTYRWAVNSGVPRFNPNGTFAGHIGSVVDIHERKEAAQVSWLLSAIVESSDDAILSKDLNGIIRSWNTGAERLFGYTPDETIGKSITMLIPQDRIDEEPDILGRLQRGERVDHFETIRKRKDGVLLNISLTISPVKDAQGRVIGASKVARDITERKRQEQALQTANAALTRSNADLQQFAYSASHDLQEPLRMVATYSELLKREFGGQLGPDGDEYIGYTVQGALRMEHLLRDLRAYTLASSSDQEPTDEVEAGEALDKALASLEALIDDSGASITRTALPRVRMREFQLEQIFQNLIGNAIHYRGTEPPRIHVAAEPRGPGMALLRPGQRYRHRPSVQGANL